MEAITKNGSEQDPVENDSICGMRSKMIGTDPRIAYGFWLEPGWPRITASTPPTTTARDGTR